LGFAPGSAAILSTGEMSVPGGDVGELHRMCGIDAKSVAGAVLQVCREKIVS
ncbi:MAG: hypothetical protein GX823_03730, partial [Clostridiales bacterium]|nr:hypothetical protein [Clostridiales bacterium]